MRMYLTFFLFFTSLTVSFAQIAVGVRVNNPLFYGSSFSGLKDRHGETISTEGNWGILNAGLFARIPLKDKHWVLQTELLYKNEGTHLLLDSEDSGAYYRDHFTFEYIDVPVLLQWEGKRMFRGFLQAGLSAKFLTVASLSRSDTPEEYNTYANFNKVTLTGQIGGGVLWDIKRVILSIDMRLSGNLTPVAGHRVRGVDFSDAFGYSATLISVGVAYKIKPTKRNNPNP